jgi:hypothetical protein
MSADLVHGAFVGDARGDLGFGIIRASPGRPAVDRQAGIVLGDTKRVVSTDSCPSPRLRRSRCFRENASPCGSTSLGSNLSGLRPALPGGVLDHPGNTDTELQCDLVGLSCLADWGISAGKGRKTLSASGPFKRCILPRSSTHVILTYSRVKVGSNDLAGRNYRPL